MKIELGLNEMFYFLEGCLCGSHLRSDSVRRFTDEFYDKFSEGERARLYNWVLRNRYNGEFKRDSAMCGEDMMFMDRYNPNNQYEVTLVDETVWRAFKSKGKLSIYKPEEHKDNYYINSTHRIPEENIKLVKKLTIENNE